MRAAIIRARITERMVFLVIRNRNWVVVILVVGLLEVTIKAN